MTFLRSTLFNVAFYANTIIRMFLCFVVFALPDRKGWGVVKSWANSSVWLLEHVGGVRSEFLGVERIPDGPLLVAAKHQSSWETFALLPFFSFPAFILKKELMRLPIFGWYAQKFKMIPIDRKHGTAALEHMNAIGRRELARNRQIIIFPEGTRRAPGAEPGYKFGVAKLYTEFNVPCLPVALNAGCYWPRQSWMRRPGTIKAEFLEPIPPGLDQKTFLQTLEDRIETSSNRLLQEARNEGINLHELS